MFCENCGSRLPDSAKFCGACGASAARKAAPKTVPGPPRVNPRRNAAPVQIQSAPPAPAKRRSGASVALFAALIVLVICAATAFAALRLSDPAALPGAGLLSFGSGM